MLLFISLMVFRIPVYTQGRTNLPPNKVPWDALQALMSQAIYGGRIDNDFDQVSCVVQNVFENFYISILVKLGGVGSSINLFLEQ